MDAPPARVDALEPLAPAVRRRVHGLILNTQLRTAVVVGADPGPSSQSLEQSGAKVTVIEDPQALAHRVPRESQDAILLLSVVERLPNPELIWLLHACRTAIRPAGVCCIVTTERYARPWVRDAARRNGEGRLFEIDALRGLVGEAFETVDAFTWNGVERMRVSGRCDDLFAVAHGASPYAVQSVPLAEARARGGGHSGWIAATVAEGVACPPRFLVRLELHVRAAPPDAVIHVLFTTADPGRYLWTAVRPASLNGNPAELMLTSDSLTRVGDAQCQQVERIVIRVRSPSQDECDVLVTDLRLYAASNS